MNRTIKIFTLLLLFSVAMVAQTIEQAVKMIEVEKYSEAKKAFESLSKSDPNAYYYLGKLAIIDSQYNVAETNFKNGLAAEEENPLSTVGLGWIKLIKHDSTAAQEDFENALDFSDEEDVKVYAAIGDAYLFSDTKNLTWVIDLLNKAKNLKKDKKNPLIFEKLGDIFVKINNGSLARENYQNAIYSDKDYIKGYLGVSGIYLRVKNYDDAKTYLDNAFAIDSTYSLTNRDYAEFYYTIKQYEKAADLYKKYIDYSEVTPAKRARFATMLYLAKKYNEAIELIKHIENTPEFNKQFQHILAFSYHSLNDPQNGIPAFEKYFGQVKPEELTTTDYEYYGKLQIAAGNDSLAIENYIKAFELDNSKIDLLGEIAALYFKAKNYPAAAEYFAKKETLSEKKLSLREYFDYGRALMFDKQYPQADSVFFKVTELKQDLPLGYLMRARTNTYIDTTSEMGLAKPHYEKFIEVATQSADSAKYIKDLVESYRYLGYFYFLKKDAPEYKDTWLEQYKNYWQKILVIDPNDVQAKEALKNVK